ncbi:MAG: exopolysaccharide biosynthesis polyprenyl glycosylphosphotransferase [Terriglobales bacterium]
MMLTVSTYLLPWAAFEVGYQVWLLLWGYWGRPASYPRSGHLGLLLLCSFVWAFMSERYSVTSVDELLRERTGAKAALSALVATSAVFLAILFFSRDDAFPRGLFLCGIVALFVLTLLMRSWLRALCRRRRAWGKPTKILIIGADDFAQQSAECLERLSLAPCQIAGYVALPGQNVAPRATPVYRLDQIGGLNAAQGFEEAIIAIHPLEFSRVPEVVKALEKLCLPARAIVDLGEGMMGRQRMVQLGRLQVLDLTSTPADLLPYAIFKRAFDLVFSALILVLTAPVFALIALLIRLTSPGPILFTQERIGLNGQTFRMFKFRTMLVSPQSESDTLWTTSNDPRRTRFGELLRRTSMDELPQFINVLKGEMSVVGPRPERPFFVDKFLGEVRRYNHRHSLKVGITGWAQVCGWRGDTSIEKRIEHDLYYLQNWTFTFDLQILAMTLFSALTNKNAY